MATHAPPDLGSLRRTPAAPRPTYNVASSCIGISISIALLVALLITLALI